MAQTTTDIFLVMGAVHRGTSDWVRTGLPGKKKLSVLSLSVLKYLNENPGIAQGELGKVLRRDPMTMSQSIRSLQAEGLIAGQADKEDKRIKRLSLSKKGVALAKNILDAEDQIIKKFGKSRAQKLAKELSELDEVLSEVFDR